MCGFCGFLQIDRVVEPHALASTVGRMADTLAHRGPDDSGVWIDAEAGVALGHRRLSIIDLSAEGHQPMASRSGRYVISYNGEIYNFRELRKELDAAGVPWRGHSDTEVMLAGFEHWGIEGALQRFNGMFAFALWDRDERTLHLARDRLGEKPLYYGWVGKTFLFGSELKSLRAHPAWNAAVDRNALAAYLRHNYVPTPYSIYQGISKLPPAHHLQIGSGPQEAANPRPYWNLREVAERGAATAAGMPEAEAVDQLELRLKRAVGLRMVADVPIGAFLSGGIDSSMVVALMQAQSMRPVRTFSIGFEEQGYNEAVYAKAVAQHLKTDHTELYVTADEAMSAIPRLPDMYDEPFADSSQIPTYLMSVLARRHVTVTLSGDGGDELFGGYVRYFWGRRIWGKMKVLPFAARRLGAAALTALSPASWNALLSGASRVLPSKALREITGDRLHKLAEVLAVPSPEVLYRGLVSHWNAPESIVPGSREPSTLLTDQSQWPAFTDFTQRMMYFDTAMYLPDDILVKVDRASMAVGLEARVPLLDHEVVEYAWSVPLDMKIRGNEGKWLLREVLYRYVPRSLLDRPKMGFGVPLDTWLRGPLRAWAEDLLEEGRLRRDGYFDAVAIRAKWNEHLSGARNWQYWLWDILMFQAWLDRARA